MTEYTIDMIKGTTVMEQMRSLIKVVIDFINSGEGDVEELRQMILTEIADRTAQDGQLQLQIQAEATARISQDNELRTAIQTETGQREAQVQQLTADIEYEQQTRQDSDDALETAIQTAVQGEADARQAQDNTIQQALQNEVTARQTQDAQLSSDIQNEASQRASADSGLSHDITDLTTRVGTVETSVADIISGSQVVGAAQNQGHADTQSEAQVGDHIVSTTANIGDDTHPVKIVNGVPVQVTGELQGKLVQGTGITIDANNKISQSVKGYTYVEILQSHYSSFSQYMQQVFDHLRANLGEMIYIDTLTGGTVITVLEMVGFVTPYFSAGCQVKGSGYGFINQQSRVPVYEIQLSTGSSASIIHQSYNTAGQQGTRSLYDGISSKSISSTSGQSDGVFKQYLVNLPE